MNRGAWWVTVHGVTKCQMQLRDRANTLSMLIFLALSGVNFTEWIAFAWRHLYDLCDVSFWELLLIGFWFLGQEDLLEKVMSIHSSIPVRRIPWTEEPCRVQSVGSQSETTEQLMLSLFFSYFKNCAKQCTTLWSLMLLKGEWLRFNCKQKIQKNIKGYI